MKPDAIIFDLDGTLWDAVPTYAKAWNIVLQNHKIDKYLHPNQLHPLMGLQAEIFLDRILTEQTDSERLTMYNEIVELQDELILKEGGKLYDGVEEGLRKLCLKYQLMILSNCPAYTIHHFLEWSGLEECFTDHLSYGLSPVSKAENLKILTRKNNLSSPVYVGDTDSDSQQAIKAEVPFMFADYGFGTTKKYQLRFESFNHLSEFFLEL